MNEPAPIRWIDPMPHVIPSPKAYLIWEVDGTAFSGVPKVVAVALTPEDAEDAKSQARGYNSRHVQEVLVHERTDIHPGGDS